MAPISRIQHLDQLEAEYEGRAFNRPNRTKPSGSKRRWVARQRELHRQIFRDVFLAPPASGSFVWSNIVEPAEEVAHPPTTTTSPIEVFHLGDEISGDPDPRKWALLTSIYRRFSLSSFPPSLSLNVNTHPIPEVKSTEDLNLLLRFQLDKSRYLIN